MIRQLQLETSWGPLNIAGGSRAGEGTLILLPQLHLALDAGRPHRALTPMKTVLISHGHMDHLGGLGYWASQRQLQSMGPARVAVPHQIAGSVRDLLANLATMEGGAPYDVEVVGVTPGQPLPLRRDMTVTFFATDHWVPTLGSILVWRRHHLLPELAGLTGEEIAHRRSEGERVTEETATEVLTYCADSGPGVLDAGSPALESEVLLLECSFFRQTDRERALRFGHLHLDDILERIECFRCRHLVLLHASRRHRLRDVEEILRDRLEPVLECSLHHLMIDWE